MARVFPSVPRMMITETGLLSHSDKKNHVSSMWCPVDRVFLLYGAICPLGGVLLYHLPTCSRRWTVTKKEVVLGGLLAHANHHLD